MPDTTTRRPYRVCTWTIEGIRAGCVVVTTTTTRHRHIVARFPATPKDGSMSRARRQAQTLCDTLCIPTDEVRL